MAPVKCPKCRDRNMAQLESDKQFKRWRCGVCLSYVTDDMAHEVTQNKNRLQLEDVLSSPEAKTPVVEEKKRRLVVA